MNTCDRLRNSVLLLLFGALANAMPAAELTVNADLREAARGLFHASLNIPVQSGSVTLMYPKWIPGEHGPTGPIRDFAVLKISAGGKSLPWRRDLVDMYAFHVEVPAGVTSI